jgi:hypothetical protein
MIQCSENKLGEVTFFRQRKISSERLTEARAVGEKAYLFWYVMSLLHVELFWTRVILYLIFVLLFFDLLSKSINHEETHHAINHIFKRILLERYEKAIKHTYIKSDKKYQN